MRCALAVLLSVALVGAAPSLLPGDPRLEGGDHPHHHGDHGGHHGEHHGDHGAHQGEHHGDHGAHHGEHHADQAQPGTGGLSLPAGEPAVVAPAVADGVPDLGYTGGSSYGEGQVVTSSTGSAQSSFVVQPAPQPQPQTQPEPLPQPLPQPQPLPPAQPQSQLQPQPQPHPAPVQTQHAQAQSQQFSGNPFFNGQANVPRVQVPHQPVPRPTRPPPTPPTPPTPPPPVNTNPLGGPAGPKGPVRDSCPAPPSALPCVPDAECDPYTGFLKSDGVKLPYPITKNTPTVAIGQCRLGGGRIGVCCKRFPKPPPTTKPPPTKPPYTGPNPFIPDYKPADGY